MRRRRGLWLLGLGAALGVAVAASGLIARERPGVPADAVAVVNGQPIAADEYARVLAAVAGDRRTGTLAADDRRALLDRMIDETLLVQRGLHLGLVWRDGKVRKDVATAVIDQVVAGTADRQPTDAELAAFYAAERDRFVRPGRLRLRQVFAAAPDTTADAPARDRAAAAAARLRAGDDFAAVRAALGDDEVAPLPDASLPPTKLADYLGPTVVRTALGLDPGAVSDPIRSSDGYHVLQMLERLPDEAPPLADIRDEVVREWRRQAGDQALRAYLDDLRRRAAIEVRPQVP